MLAEALQAEVDAYIAQFGNDRDTCKTGQGLIFSDTGNAWAPVVRECYLLPPRLCRLLISQLRRVNVPRARQPDIRRITPTRRAVPIRASGGRLGTDQPCLRACDETWGP